ncbi:MAG: hypothetical protein R2817_12145 [Flavobacteriales bacterium]
MRRTQRPIRVLLSLWLVSSLLFGLLLPSAVVVHFQVKRAEIIATRCVERAKPIERNCCKGSCQLKRELKKASAATDTPTAPPRLEPYAPVAFLPLTAVQWIHVVHTTAQPPFRVALCEGYPIATEHVPWQG